MKGENSVLAKPLLDEKLNSAVILGTAESCGRLEEPTYC